MCHVNNAEVKASRRLNGTQLPEWPEKSAQHTIAAEMEVVYAQVPTHRLQSQTCLLSAPSFSMPSHPVIFPAISSTFPYPSVFGSRFALAAFIASTPWLLSVEPDSVHAAEPVTFPMAS